MMKTSDKRAYIPTRLLIRLAAQTKRLRNHTRAVAYAELLRNSVPDDGRMRYFGPAIGEGASHRLPSLTSNSSISTSGPATPALTIPTLALIPPSPQLKPSIDLFLLDVPEENELKEAKEQQLLTPHSRKKPTGIAKGQACNNAVVATTSANAPKASPVLWITHLFPASADKKSKSAHADQLVATPKAKLRLPLVRQQGAGQAAVSGEPKSTISNNRSRIHREDSRTGTTARHPHQSNNNTGSEQPRAGYTATHPKNKSSNISTANATRDEALIQRQRTLIQNIERLSPTSPEPKRQLRPRPRMQFIPASVPVFPAVSKAVSVDVIVHVTLEGDIVTTPDLACVKVLGSFHPCLTWGCQVCGEHIRYREWRV